MTHATSPSFVSVESLTPVAYQGKPVITTEALAAVYGTEPGRIWNNHNRNQGRFVPDKHFFKVTGGDLADLRLSLGEGQISPKVRHLILWTERGAARHAKMLDTDQAWDVFEKLEDAYFRPRESTQGTTDQRPIPDLTQCPPGTGAMVTESGIVWFDATSTDVMDGESALVVRNWRTRPQVPFVAPVRVLKGYDLPAETGCAHLPPEPVAFLPKGLHSPIPCRILGRFLLEKPRPKALSVPDIARCDSRIAELEHREAQLLAIIERLSGSLAAPAAPAPARTSGSQPDATRSPMRKDGYGRRLTDEVVAKARDLIDQGLIDQAIADRIGISRPSVRRIRVGLWPNKGSRRGRTHA